MESKKIAGRILIMPKGEYDENSVYEMMDLVSYNGISWLAKKNVSGIEPSEVNVEYWHKMFDISEYLACNDCYIRKLDTTAIIMKSAMEGSNKRFEITVDDSGTLSAAEIDE